MGRIGVRLLVVLIVGAAALLFSMGGAILAAPVTVPVVTYAITRDELTRGWRIAGGLILALTLAQCAWAVGFFVLDETHLAVWLYPVVVLAICAAVGISLLFRHMGRHG